MLPHYYVGPSGWKTYKINLRNHLIAFIFAIRCLHNITMETRRDVFQAIADPTRREIIRVITEKNMTLNGVAELFDISRQAISNHVKILTECGLVIINPKGRERYCAINPETLKEVATWVEPYKKLWERRLDKLGGLLDELQTGN